jgi:hypothetical protein
MYLRYNGNGRRYLSYLAYRIASVFQGKEYLLVNEYEHDFESYESSDHYQRVEDITQ